MAGPIEKYSTNKAPFSVSDTGVLAFRQAPPLRSSKLKWRDRAGNELAVIEAIAGQYTGETRLSPDRARVAVTRTDPDSRNDDIWLIDLKQKTSYRFTFDPHTDGWPVWSPDSSRIVFASNRNDGIFNVYIRDSGGAGKDELLLRADNHTIPNDWSSDGRYLIFEKSNIKGKLDLWVLPMFPAVDGKDRKPFPYLESDFVARRARLSPDGQWAAYLCDESGSPQAYVQTFPVAGRRWQIPSAAVHGVEWGIDGKELFVWSSGGKLSVVPVHASGPKDNPTLMLGEPQTLFNTNEFFMGVGDRRQLFYVTSTLEIHPAAGQPSYYHAELARPPLSPSGKSGLRLTRRRSLARTALTTRD